MPVKLFRVILPVADIEAASRFYLEVLGSPGHRISPGRHYFDCGGTILACFDPQSDGDGYMPKPLTEWLYFAVSNLEAVYDACKTAGAKFDPSDVHGDPAGQIATRPWGERSFYVFDPWGNKLCFVDQRTVFKGP
jgi:catechol 2,3-dioxygenase-like lactoylglutathione lyase family enzyme